MATVRDILQNKGPAIHTVSIGSTVLDAVHYMNQHQIGAVVVVDGERVSGIFTERDVLRRVIEELRRPGEIAVVDVMTSQVMSCAPDTSLDDVSRIMRDKRIRHLPVCETDGRLLGMISIGDINAQHASEQEATINSLHDYIYGPVHS